MARKKFYERPRIVFLDWLLKTAEGYISYKKTKDVSSGQITMMLNMF